MVLATTTCLFVSQLQSMYPEIVVWKVHAITFMELRVSFLLDTQACDLRCF